jgi:hypothetical protein
LALQGHGFETACRKFTNLKKLGSSEKILPNKQKTTTKFPFNKNKICNQALTKYSHGGHKHKTGLLYTG